MDRSETGVIALAGAVSQEWVAGMHIIAIAAVVIALIILFILMTRGTQRTGDMRSAPASNPGTAAKSWQHGLAFISNGKLFYQAPGQELRELQSPTSGR